MSGKPASHSLLLLPRRHFESIKALHAHCTGASAFKQQTVSSFTNQHYGRTTKSLWDYRILESLFYAGKKFFNS